MLTLNTLNIMEFQQQGVLVENDSAFVVEDLVEDARDSDLEGSKKDRAKDDTQFLVEAPAGCFSELDTGRVKHQSRFKDCTSDGECQEKSNRGKGKLVLRSFTRVPSKPSRLDL